MNKVEFSQSLIEVRKAYRLLYLYQSRVLNLMKFIEQSFDMKYNGGWSWFSDNTPREGKGTLDNSAWDWLNMYFYEFNFQLGQRTDSETSFAILLLSDTGIYDTDSEEYLNVSTFNAPEKSSTRLVFIAGKNTWWNKPPFKEDFDERIPIYTSSPVPYCKSIGDDVMLAKSYPLEDFLNQESTLVQLRDWAEFCKKNGVSGFSIR